MKKILLVPIIFWGLESQAQTANAGADQTIYLTQTSTVTLNGSGSSGTSYLWSKLYLPAPPQSTNPVDPATITSPTSATTTVTGIVQGNWFYQIAVTTGATTKYDTVVVRVNYDVPPGTYLRGLPLPQMRSVVNDRHDTTSCCINYSISTTEGTFTVDRPRNPDMFIDPLNSNIWSTVEDGYAWNNSGYGRTELSYAGSAWPLDTTKTYCFEWKGYFAQDLSTIIPNPLNQATIIMQIHQSGSEPKGPPFEFIYWKGGLYFQETMTGYNGSNATPAFAKTNTYTDLSFSMASLYNHAHTIRWTVREGAGYPGQDAFIKVEIDGIQKYYRNTGQVGEWATNNIGDQDYIKFNTIYDYSNVIADPSNHTRGRKVTLVTQAFNVYQLTTTNQPPVANAGSDQVIVLPTSNVSLAGSGTDANGTIASYSWTKMSGPTGCTIVNPTSSGTSVTGLAQGVYQFQLKVTDNNGATGTDVMQVTVNAATNQPPVANAGQEQAITLPTNSLTLAGSGTDADGTIASYSWTKISGPSAYSIVNPTSSGTSINSLVQGVYLFQLKVTDNNGARGTDTMQVTVNAAPNQPPAANAGPDQTITLPINTVSLSGSGSDADGTVVSYAWTKISGPSGYTIANATSAVTNINGLVQGVYQFQLKVTDNNGATGTDVVLVTVNAAANQPPVANAGADQTITLPINTVSLAGSGSDADGTIASYSWTKISGPSAYTIVNSASPGTSINGLVQGVYQFQLKVTDNNGATGTDVVQVTVNAAANQPPVANAGPDQTITLPANSVTLSGSGSDADGTVSSYAWTKISGPSSYSITNASSAVTAITGLAQGVYQFQLKVTDNDGAIGTDVIQVTVNAAANVPPVANAGADQTITLPINTVSLSGSGTDADGTVVSYQWTKISGPSGYTIANATSAGTNINGLVQGVYQFQLQVTDNDGATGTDVIQVTVNAAANIAPVANAGADQTITLPINTVSLSGSGTDADGTVVSYQWTKISGPSGYTIANATSAVTNINGLVEGVYQFQLQVTDNEGATGTDVIQVTVNAAANQPPVANAGADQTITLPINTVSLSGSGTDADGTVVSYQWTKISGPSSYTIANATSAGTNINGLVQGVYQFRLQVTDNDGAIGTDVIQVTVNAAANIPPVADAGADQSITLPINTVTLSGSGSDADGTVVSYAWTKISGPSGYTIANATSAVTNINGLVEGVYQFQLQVTDNSGAIGTDVIQVTVNAAANIAPVADAGADQTITLPINMVTLSGSGSDADGTVVSYQWTKISGPSNYNIVNATSTITNINGLVQGVYQFQLQVTDNDGATGTDVIQVTVNAAANIPPVADAGADQSITLPINTVTLSGSGSDADGTVVSYAWTKISGPSGYTIANATSAVTNINGLVEGVYQFQLQVTDNSGAIGTDVIQVTVNAAANIPPVADAGADQTITLPINMVTLSGSGSDADGTVVSYQWTKISGPSNYNIVNATSTITNINGLVQGVYQFQLQVTDNDGATGTDVIQVTVNAAANIPPVANAGPDQSITLPINTVTLSGSGSDADGTVVSYQWTKISGPSGNNIVNANSPGTDVTGLVQGVYQFQLQVTDNSGAIGTDIMQVFVYAAANTPPVADAGSDKTITLPTNSLTVSGSGSDADGTVVSYQWTKISGPSSYTIVDATSAATTIGGLVQGVYEFELRVTDNNGGRGRDTMQVTVNAAANIPPIAYAGSDVTITLPVNTVSIAGSGSDADGTVVSYLWTKISGPSTYNITNASSPVTDVWGLVPGVYQFEIKVTDNNGAMGRDTMQIIIEAAGVNNIAPIANAGKDQTINLPTDSVTLSGSGTDADGIIAGYSWKQVSGPTGSAMVSSNDAVTLVNQLMGGTYEFELTVTDNLGAVGKDTVVIVVAEPRLNLSVQSNVMKVYPNPVIDVTTLEISTTHVYSKLLLVVTDMSSKIVIKEDMTPGQSNIKQMINMSNLSKGTYVITVYFNEVEKQSIKVVRL